MSLPCFEMKDACTLVHLQVYRPQGRSGYSVEFTLPDKMTSVLLEGCLLRDHTGWARCLISHDSVTLRDEHVGAIVRVGAGVLGVCMWWTYAGLTIACCSGGRFLRVGVGASCLMVNGVIAQVWT